MLEKEEEEIGSGDVVGLFGSLKNGGALFSSYYPGALQSGKRLARWHSEISMISSAVSSWDYKCVVSKQAGQLQR